ncbi:hypothetical protein NL676_011611 [Syzygium grande]|nr:hypothetical protein NL676_011611 [Syzygium grande]
MLDRALRKLLDNHQERRCVEGAAILKILQGGTFSSPFVSVRNHQWQTPFLRVVTGSNKGIGFAICKLLASKGIVVLTARDEKRGLEAVDKLKLESCLSDLVFFHQLDVSNPTSVSSLADFIKRQFGKLDILVNNAGVLG